MPRVSVIIPTHNRPEYLARALASVQAQTMPDFEVFVVDDGSPDDRAAEVVRACNDPRIHYVRLPESRGPAAARNAGILRSTAPYIAFLDDDDEWLPEKLEVQLAAYGRLPSSVAVVYTARVTLHAASNQRTITRFPSVFDPVNVGNTVTTSSVLVRRTHLADVGIFDERLAAVEDFDLWIRLFGCYRLVYLDTPLVVHRVHQQRVSQQHLRVGLALERLLDKHRTLLLRNPYRFGLQYALLAQQYRMIGETRRARIAFIHAVRIWLREPRSYLRLLRSLLRSRWLPRRVATRLLAGSL